MLKEYACLPIKLEVNKDSTKHLYKVNSKVFYIKFQLDIKWALHKVKVEYSNPKYCCVVRFSIDSKSRYSLATMKR